MPSSPNPLAPVPITLPDVLIKVAVLQMSLDAREAQLAAAEQEIAALKAKLAAETNDAKDG